MKKSLCMIVTLPYAVGFFVEQLNYLKKNDYTITVVCRYSEELEDQLSQSDIEYHPIQFPRGMDVVNSLKSVKELHSFLKENQFDVIQYSTPNAALYTSMVSKFLGYKIRNYHYMGYRFNSLSGAKRLVMKNMEKLTCSLSTHIEIISENNRKFGVSEGLFSEEKSTIVWNGSTGGIDLKRFNLKARKKYREKMRNDFQFTDSDLVFGFVGRLSEDKGVNELIEAFSQITDKRVKLIIVGDDEGEFIKGKEIELNQNVHYRSFTSKVAKYYSMIDCLILPTYREGFGNVIGEALAMGVPVISSDVPGPNDIIKHDYLGLLAEPKNSESLHSKMLEFMANINFYDENIEKRFEYIKQNFDSETMMEFILNRKDYLVEMSKQ